MKIHLIVVVGLALCLTQVGCGGGGGGAEPKGLFENNTNTSTSPSAGAKKADPAGAGRVLSASDVALGSSFQAGNNGTSGKSLGKRFMLNPSPGFGGFFSGVGKGPTVNMTTSCREIDPQNLVCNASAVGPSGGDVNVTSAVHVTEDTATKQSGTVALTFNFNNFEFKDDSCGKAIRIGGIFGCELDITMELIDQTQFDYRFGANCNTAKDSDLYLDIVIAEAAHRVGYDLALNYQTKFNVNELKTIHLSEADITGTVSVDSVNYPYAELRKVLGTSSCE